MKRFSDDDGAEAVAGAPREEWEEVLDEVGAHEDRAAELGRAVSPLMLHQAEELYAAYRKALTCPERFASGKRQSSSEVRQLVERSIRAEFALALGVSEWVAARVLEHAQLLLEDLPATRQALRDARILWEAAQAICTTAGSLPQSSRAEFDRCAVAAAAGRTPTQLRRVLNRLREELHDQPFDERHAAAAERRTVWLSPERDGMCVLSALLPAHLALGAYDRVDRIAKSLRNLDGEERTLAQLRADAVADILTDGEITGSTPEGSSASGPARPATFVPGVRAEVSIVVPVLTAARLGDEAAELDGYGPIPASVARELVGTGSSFYRVLTDPITGQVVSVGQMRRTPPKSMRHYLKLRDQTCRFFGCTRRAKTSEVDHTLEWAKGGDTDIRNLMHVCVGHHHVRHGDGWSYRLNADASADWTSPSGRRVTTRPPRLPGATADLLARARGRDRRAKPPVRAASPGRAGPPGRTGPSWSAGSPGVPMSDAPGRRPRASESPNRGPWFTDAELGRDEANGSPLPF